MGTQTSVESRKGTEIGRVRGLGSAHSGAGHWLAQQISSAASLVTTVYLAVSFLLLPDFSYATVRPWIGSPLPALAIGLMIVAVFRHTQLGLTTLIEDYSHNPATKFALLLVLKLATFAGGAFGLLCLVRMVLGETA